MLVATGSSKVEKGEWGAGRGIWCHVKQVNTNKGARPSGQVSSKSVRRSERGSTAREREIGSTAKER